MRNALLAAAFLAGIALLSGYGAPSPESVRIANLPPCVTEDSPNCFWDAQTMGNGQGHSFYDIDGTTHYVSN